MYPRHERKDGQFLRGVLIFGGSLVGLLAIGVFLSNVLGGGDDPVNTVAETEVPTLPPVAEVIEDTTPFIETIPDPVVREVQQVTYAEAESAFTDKRYSEALDLFTIYTDQRPGNAWGHYMFGLSAWKASEPEAAILGFEEAIKLDPNHLKSRTNIVRVLLDECRPGEALDHARKATEIDPENGETHRILARVYHNLGEVDPAVTSYRQAITLNGKDVWAMNNLGFLLIECERFDEALAPLSLATKLDNGQVLFENNLGIALERTGRYRQARYIRPLSRPPQVGSMR
jgi:tetratricopeptide (TPR) repeat protein